MKSSKAQIIGTIGPSSENYETLSAMIRNHLDVIRMNFSWGSIENRVKQIALIRQIEKEIGQEVLILQDVPGPRIQQGTNHTYDTKQFSAITEHDKEFIKFGVEQSVDCIALSFVGSARDVEEGKALIKEYGGTQTVIAKIERKIAVDTIDEIIQAADAIMIARGDLGNEIPIEQIPFIQAQIIAKAKKAGKPVITATQMMLSMVDNSTPSRAEVTDVANAILQGSDAVMLSEETARGKYPVEAVLMMEKIVLEAERHLHNPLAFNLLTCQR